MRRLSIIDIETGQQPYITRTNQSGSYSNVRSTTSLNYGDARSERSRFTRKATRKSSCTLGGVRSGVRHHLTWHVRHRAVGFAYEAVHACARWLGIKPLYYSETARGLFFGSELKSLLAHTAVKRQPDYDAINAYLELQYIPAPMSAIQGIRKLLPGHYMLLQNGRLTIREYWDAPLAPEVNGRSYDDLKEELEDELTRAVKMQLITDVPLGVFLSGGVDSSLVAILMAREMGEPVKSFSIGFDYEEFDELKYARMIAERYETDHHEEIVHAEAIDMLPKIVRFYDETVPDSSAIRRIT